MKRLISVLLVSFMVFTLSSCRKNSPADRSYRKCVSRIEKQVYEENRYMDKKRRKEFAKKMAENDSECAFLRDHCTHDPEIPDCKDLMERYR